MDEGTCDYLTATMLDTPHIWVWHRRHDEEEVHPRSLISSRTMADYDPRPEADPHTNGTIWAAALWGLRTRWAETEQDGARMTDRLVIQALLVLGCLVGEERSHRVTSLRRARVSYAAGLAALLQAEEQLHGGRYHNMILASFASRGIQPHSYTGIKYKTNDKQYE